MKRNIIILGAAALLLTFSSCRSEDDFTDSIFDTSMPAIDQTKATYPFDKWLYDNFLMPYNVEVQYQFNFPASDPNFQLTPADYNRSQVLAHFIRYLFYDVYTKYAGDNFMKQYGPRIFHFIGSTGYSPTTGTEVLGTAAGGVKITLYNVNEVKRFTDDVSYSPEDVEVLNERIFHTMHHEFSHILHQTKSYPVTFGQVTSGSYDPITWHERDSTTTHQLGYVTHYASSANYEDFVETLSCIITDTDIRWMNRIIDASLVLLQESDREDIYNLVDSLGIDPDLETAPWNNISFYAESEYSSETGTYLPTGRLTLANFRSAEKVVNKEVTAYVDQYKYTLIGESMKFRDFISLMIDLNDATKRSDTKSPAGYKQMVEKLTNAGFSFKVSNPGINAINKKINIATEWYTDRWGLHAFELRQEVRERQEAINDYLHSENMVVYDLK